MSYDADEPRIYLEEFLGDLDKVMAFAKDSGDCETAEQCFTETISVLHHIYDDSMFDFEIAEDLQFLASMYYTLRFLDRAEERYCEALRIYDRLSPHKNHVYDQKLALNSAGFLEELVDIALIRCPHP